MTIFLENNRTANMHTFHIDLLESLEPLEWVNTLEDGDVVPIKVEIVYPHRESHDDMVVYFALHNKLPPITVSINFFDDELAMMFKLIWGDYILHDLTVGETP